MRFEFEVERAGEQGPGETPLDEWALRLPRRCDSWEIGEGSLGEVLAAARAFRVGLDEAISQLEQEETKWAGSSGTSSSGTSSGYRAPATPA